MRVPLGESCAPVGVAMTTSKDAVFLVGGIALEDPSTVVPISAFWNGRGWVSGGGRWSSLRSLSDVVVLMTRFCGYCMFFGPGLSIDWVNSFLLINVRRNQNLSKKNWIELLNCSGLIWFS